MKRKFRHWVFCALIAVGSTLAAWSLSNVTFFQLLNLKTQDLQFIVRDLLRGKPAITNIVLLTADQKALDSFDEPKLFWNKYYADAIAAAAEAGAKVIGLDLAFGVAIDKWEKDADELLGGAVSSASVPVVVGFVEKLNSNKASQSISVNMVASGLGLDAFANITADPDDFIRRQELLEAPSSNPNDPPSARSLGMRVVEKYLNAEAQFQNGQLSIGGQPIPTDAQRFMVINYAGGPNTFPSVSLADFEAAIKAGDKAKLRNWVNGKIVLLGADSVEDRFSTPFFTPLRPKSNTAGVEIHANAIRTLLERRFLLPVPQWSRVLAFLLVSAITVLIATTFSAGRAAALIFAEILAVLVATYLVFESGSILSSSELLLAASVCLLASVVYRFATAEKRGNLFQRAVSVFVGRELATSLDETEKISLTGKRLDVTILFTDIRGFTAFTEEVCEKEGPEAVVKMLNDYMAAMCAVIVKYHGHVNKFIGDGILAVFSDDDPGAVPGDHPVRTVLCATEMVTLPSRFSTGAGIHTGAAVVGNVGSADKMEYTVLGDTVNLASRLESLNKEHHTKLLMTGVTQHLLGDKVETIHLADVPVRGKTIPVSLFTVASLVPKAAVNA
ncbi:MAG TPA: adenylate/guanylate cyclase domain-containing protein [Bryobacteraceae bacterium]|nr:adenylate/guanylate cyclase domain-containing protein [Bryobacteraceae bacterium]